MKERRRVGRRDGFSRVGYRLHNGSAIEYRGDGLFGGLAIVLMLAIGRTGGLAICVNCGRHFEPARQGVKYCQDCRNRRVPIRDAQRARRERLRAQERKEKPE